MVHFDIFLFCGLIIFHVDVGLRVNILPLVLAPVVGGHCKQNIEQPMKRKYFNFIWDVRCKIEPTVLGEKIAKTR